MAEGQLLRITFRAKGLLESMESSLKLPPSPKYTIWVILFIGSKKYGTKYLKYVSKKPDRTCVKSSVAAVHCKKLLKHCARPHAHSNGLHTAICVQRTKSSHSLVHGAAIVEAWVY